RRLSSPLFPYTTLFRSRFEKGGRPRGGQVGNIPVCHGSCNSPVPRPEGAEAWRRARKNQGLSPRSHSAAKFLPARAEGRAPRTGTMSKGRGLFTPNERYCGVRFVNP